MKEKLTKERKMEMEETGKKEIKKHEKEEDFESRVSYQCFPVHLQPSCSPTTTITVMLAWNINKYTTPLYTVCKIYMLNVNTLNAQG